MDEIFRSFFSTNGFMPHGHCYLWKPSLVVTMVVTDSLIGLAYVSISLSLYALVRKIQIPFSVMFLAFGLFIGACGMTHFMEVYTLWWPQYWLSAWVKTVTALASVATAVFLIRLKPNIVAFADAAKVSAQRGVELERAYEQLDVRVKERTRELEESERRFRSITEWIPQLVWTARSDGEIFYVNQRWTDFSGLQPGESLGWGWQPVIHPDDLERTLRVWRNSLETGQDYSIEHRLRNASGTYHWMLSIAFPIRGPTGEILQWFGTSTDIDDQKRSQERLRFLSEVSTALSESLDYDANLLRLAQLVVRRLATGCMIHLVNESGSLRLMAAEHRDPEKAQWVREMAEKLPIDPHRPPVRPEVIRIGGVSWSVLIVPIREKERTIGTITMVSSERSYSEDDVLLAEEIARRAYLAFQNSQLYAQAQAAIRARDEFLSIASHELKTPITSLALRLRILGRSKDQGPVAIERTVETANRQIVRLTGLIEDLLDVARIQSGRLTLRCEDVDLSEVVQEAVDRCSADLAAVGCTLDTRIEPGIHAYVDRLRIDQVVVNLLSNVSKYAPKAPVKVELSRVDRRAKISVQDRGPGIAEENLKRIFERFDRGGATSGIAGLGLGLFITRQIIESHGGRVWAENMAEGGARFVVELPLDSAC